MIIKAAGDKTPKFHPSVRLAENATVVGDVTLGEDVSVWYGAVLRGDSSSVSVGARSNVQDNCVIHSEASHPAALGCDVVVGHGAILHGCTVEDGCLIGMGAIVLDGAVIGAGSTVGAGALVPPGKVIPPNSLVVGVPGKVVRETTAVEREHSLKNVAHYVALGREQLPALE